MRQTDALEVEDEALQIELLTLPGYDEYSILHLKQEAGLAIQRAACALHRAQAASPVPSETASTADMKTARVNGQDATARTCCRGRAAVIIKSVMHDDNTAQHVRLHKEYQLICHIRANAQRQQTQGRHLPAVRPKSAAALLSSSSPSSSSSEQDPSDNSARQIRRAHESAGQQQQSRPDWLDRIPDAITCITSSNWSAVVLDDFGGVSLREFVYRNDQPSANGESGHGPRLLIDDAIQVAIQVSEALICVHAAKVIHKDINPDNIIARRNVDGSIQVQLIDFNISEEFSSVSAASNSTLDGTLLYISPEQTGRMERALDYRTDFYSLGITLWEMLTGRNPCNDLEPSDIVYFHLARDVPDPREIQELIPESLAGVIMKLVKKSPDDRYQSAHALYYDLYLISQHLSSYKLSRDLPAGKPLSDEALFEAFSGWTMVVGSRDFPQKLHFSDKLFGREKDFGQLVGIYEKVASGMIDPALVCLFGTTGSGRTSFFKHLDRQTCNLNACFIMASYDSSRASVPYVEFSSILDQLVRLILAKPPDEIQSWETRLKSEIGVERLGALSSIVPSIRNVVSDIKVLSWESSTSENKQLELNRAVELFLMMFCSKETPLALYLNDIKAGPGSIDMIRYLLRRKQVRPLLIVSGYELGASSTLSHDDDLPSLAEDLQADLSGQFAAIQLRPLHLDAVVAMLRDTIAPPDGNLDELAAMLLKKTHGNPQHIRELLQYCESESLIRFDFERVGWTWNLGELDRKTSMTDSVVDLLLEQLQKLAPDTLSLLKYGAAIGQAFEVRQLCDITDKTAVQVCSLLQTCVHGGFLVATHAKQISSALGSAGDNLSQSRSMLSCSSSQQRSRVCTSYRFVHNRVRIAAYRLIDETEVSQYHLSIARKIREAMAEDEIELFVFDLLAHYEKAQMLLVEEERVHLIEILARAAYRFGEANDYKKVISLLERANRLLEERCIERMWSQHYEVAYSAKFAYASTLLRCNCVDEAERVIVRMEPYVSRSDWLSWKALMLKLALFKLKFGDAISIGLAAMEDTGIHVPESAEERLALANQELDAVERLLEMHTLDSFDGSARQGDRRIATIEQILHDTTSAARMTANLPLAALTITKACAFYLEHGFGYYTYEFLAALIRYYTGSIGVFNLGRARSIGEYLIHKTPVMTYEQRANTTLNMILGYSIVWDFSTFYENTTQSAALALDCSLPTSAGLCMLMCNVVSLVSCGKSMAAIREYDRKFNNMLEGSAGYYFADWAKNMQEIEAFAVGIPLQTDPDVGITLAHARLFNRFMRFFAATVYGRSERFELGGIAKRFQPLFAGTWIYVDLVVLQIANSISLLEKQSDRQNMADALATIDEQLKVIELYATSQDSREHLCQLNFARGERERLAGNVASAAKFFEESIEQAHMHANGLYEAWAYEREGLLWLEQGMKRHAHSCLRTAKTLWEQWGCTGKAQQLATSFPEAIPPVPALSRRPSRRFKTGILLSAQRGFAGSLSEAEESSIESSLTDARSPAMDDVSPFRSDSNSGSSVGRRRVVDLDIDTVLKVADSISSETDLNEMLDKIVTHLMVNTGATRAVFLLKDDNDTLVIHAESSSGRDVHLGLDATSPEGMASPTRVTKKDKSPSADNAHGETAAASARASQSHAIGADLGDSLRVPFSIVNVVARTKEPLVFTDTPDEVVYRKDPYVEHNKPKSILCCPVKQQRALIGVIYLENHLQPATFTPKRIEIVRSLMASAAVSIENAKLVKKNTELAEALRGTRTLTSAAGGPKYNVDAPIKRVLDSLQLVKARFPASDPVVQTLDTVLTTLTSNGLFAANVDEFNDEQGRGLDQDTKTWIEASLLQQISKTQPRNQTDGAGQGSTAYLDAAARRKVSGSINDLGGSLLNHASSRGSLPNLAASKSLDMGSEHALLIQHDLASLNYAEINQYLELASRAEFDVFYFAELTCGSPLYFLSVHFFKRYGLMETFKLNENMIRNFFERVERFYHKLPYHNSAHATDVLQTMAMLLLETDLAAKFTPMEVFNVCLASAIHDLDHPGVNNMFLIQSGHPLAILYNDIAVLESHHVYKAFDIAKHQEADVFHFLGTDQYRQSRKSIISIVLATDLAQHFSIISKFKGKIAASGFKLDDEADRQLLLEMAVKCGDLGNPTKPFETAKRWTGLVMEEFFRQVSVTGDRLQFGSWRSSNRALAH
ncbi:hypothetical protein BC831DRAFT_265099 [Entophlyctis helioformis]|nr:hypothetical protein BC831DRAFT_265099 [Entophlyctis helioformis]